MTKALSKPEVWYHSAGYGHIETATVLRRTAKTLYTNSLYERERARRISDNWFPTFAEAKEHEIAHVKGRLAQAKRSVEFYERMLKKAEAL